MTILFLVKVFEEESHANDFVRGKLFAQRLCYFKKLEDRAGRGDRDEGAIVPPIDNLQIRLEARNVDTGEIEQFTFASELGAPPVLRPRWFDNVNVFCMYAGHSGHFRNVSRDNVQEFKRQLEIPASARGLVTMP